MIPELPSHVGDSVKIKTINGEPRPGFVLDEIQHVPSNNPEKAICLQLIQFAADDDPEVRVGYYMIGKKEGTKKGKWTWGQYALMTKPEDLLVVFEKAMKKGWF